MKRSWNAAAAGLLAVFLTNCRPVEWFSAGPRGLEAEERRLREELAALPALFPDQQTDRIGYSSKPANVRRGGPGARQGQPAAGPRRPETGVIRFDLGSKQKIDGIVLVPADFAVDADPGAGYGFPVRWRVELADEPSFEDAVLAADHTAADFPNPGPWPISVELDEGAAGRYVRLTAVKLWERQGRSLLALGELMVLQGGRNLAAGLPRDAIRVTDTDETPRNWSVLNLVDSQSVLGAPSGTTLSSTEGFQSQAERSPLAVKWVQVDLGRSWPLEEVRLFPARAMEFPARRGFGFPLRWRLEASVEADFARPILLGDWTKNDFANPCENPVVVPVPGTEARFVRVTALKLSERFNDFVLAMSELEVSSGGINVAAGQAVTASDSRETPRWSDRFLTDGSNSQRQLAAWPDYLKGLEQRRLAEMRLAALPEHRQELIRGRMQRIMAWVTGMLGLIILAAAWAARRNSRGRRREMEALRQRIARDVHDEIGSGLGTIALLSQMAGAKASHPAGARQDFSEINHLSREITESLRDIVWLIRPETRTLGDLAQRLRETATSMLAAVPHEFTLDPAVQRRALPLEFKRQILLVFKEALHNLMRHANASHATVNVGGSDTHFILELHDDGQGFDPTAPVSGAGLTGMKQRAATLGGQLEITTAPTQGTRLKLAVPWP
jgi:signal transduction histidine kinase